MCFEESLGTTLAVGNLCVDFWTCSMLAWTNVIVGFCSVVEPLIIMLPKVFHEPGMRSTLTSCTWQHMYIEVLPCNNVVSVLTVCKADQHPLLVAISL